MPTDSPRTRFLYRASALAAGGRITRVDPAPVVNIPIPSIAPSLLPVVGGRAEAKSRRDVIDTGKIQCDPETKAALRKVKRTRLLSISQSYTLVESDPELPGKPIGVRVTAMAKGIEAAGGVSVKLAQLNLRLTQDLAQQEQPRIIVENTEITGLKLGKFALKVKLDLDTFNSLPTLREFEERFRQDRALRERLGARVFSQARGTTLFRSKSGYALGSLVESIEGKLPKDAYIEPNGYTIVWPEVFGRIVLGEILMTEYGRRVTLIRFERGSPIAGFDCAVEGDIGAGTMP